VAVGVLALAAGLFGGVPHAGWSVGLGVLATLLGVTAASPVLSRPFLGLARAGYARLFGPMGNLAGQNALRNPRRTTATASALMIGLTLAFTVAILGASAKASVDKQVSENFIGDYIVSSAFGQPFSPTIAERMAKVDGVGAILRERYGIGSRAGSRQGIAATAPSDIGAFDLTMAAGRADDLADDTVLLEADWAESHDLGVGDTVKFEMPTGTKSWTVVGVYEDNPIVFFPVLTTIDTLLESGFPDQDNFVVIYADPGASGVQDRLDAVVAKSPVVSVKDQQEFAAEQRGPIDQIIGIIYVLLVFAVAIAVLGIINTLALSIIERTREIGLLRAIGVSRRQLRTMIRLESVVIAFLGALQGVVLGIGFGIALMYAVRDEGLDVIRIPVGQLFVFLALSMVVGVLAAVLPARRAARLDVLKAISTD
jgi:putative ABC transport system permease protein